MVVGGPNFGRRQTGNPVRIRDGPAAVTEKTRSFLKEPLSATADEKACLASARESEDLPTLGMWMAARDGRREQVSLRIAAWCCFARDG